MRRARSWFRAHSHSHASVPLATIGHRELWECLLMTDSLTSPAQLCMHCVCPFFMRLMVAFMQHYDSQRKPRWTTRRTFARGHFDRVPLDDDKAFEEEDNQSCCLPLVFVLVVIILVAVVPNVASGTSSSTRTMHALAALVSTLLLLIWPSWPLPSPQPLPPPSPQPLPPPLAQPPPSAPSLPKPLFPTLPLLTCPLVSPPAQPSSPAPLPRPSPLIPPPLPPPPAAPPLPLADELNAHYRRGTAGSRLRDAGVLLRLFDGLSSTEHHWEGGGSFWMANDRFSASLINEQRPVLYNYVDGGFIIDADAAQRCLLCACTRGGSKLFPASTRQRARADATYTSHVRADPSDGHSGWFRCKPPRPPGRSDDCIPGCASIHRTRPHAAASVVHKKMKPNPYGRPVAWYNGKMELVFARAAWRDHP